MADQQPSEAPPSYEAATKHRARNGIPAERRRSMEDEARSLPQGWVRSYDPETEHQFFVDTSADPPRSIWHHPHDDEQYLSTLSHDERENVNRLHRSISLQDIAAESSDDEDEAQHRSINPAQPNKPNHPPPQPIKDRMTHTNHQQRVAARERRAEQERQAYAAHLAARRALARAMETGEPQYLCKDKQGRDVYIVPPNGRNLPSGAFGYNPYAQGIYGDPSNRFLRPQQPYYRPYGYGYGGGYGFPLLGGVMGGALLGGLLF
ncbi:WW/Rsp5/WWP [Botryosphaeria dothidea]|uniref:WW/Rsp5/WWP n=1 Tax=Botryosphaeria dothidea TaxID=55169 RepID=A0A8H4N3H0_9PEZI|nr:WW/Rsp5/WWP [Botryosphaeria dothidea]